MNIKLLFTLLFLYTLSSSQQTGYFQQKVEYKMNIDMDVKTYQYKGEQTIKYTNNSPNNLKKIYFHLYWNAFQPGSAMDKRVQWMTKNADRRMIVDTISYTSRISKLTPDKYGYQKINSLKINGIECDYNISGTILEVNLKNDIKKGETVNIEMLWDAQVPDQIRRAGRNNSENVALTMTQWYPKIVEYDYEGWHAFEYIGREFHGVFGNFDVTINIDKNYVVGAGGVLQNPNEVKGYEKNTKIKSNKKNQASWKYKAENIHDFAWAADPDYKVEKQNIYNGMPVYYIFQENNDTKIVLDSIKPIINDYFKIMNTTFGQYPYPNYSFIQGGDGGMEYGMCTMILWNKDKKTKFDDYIEGLCHLMVHESAHSWFQQIIATNESMRAWMDEGFTTYAEEYALYKIKPERYKNLPNPFFSLTNVLSKIQNSNKEEPMDYLADHYNKSNSYSSSAYIKGACVLVGLGYIVGEEKLAEIMKEYYNQWSFKHPNERDFMSIAQEVSEMDLKWYFNYMINTTRKVDYAIKEVNANNNTTDFTIERIGEFPMPLDIYVILKDGSFQVFNIPLADMRGEKSSIGFQSTLSKDILPVKLQYLQDISWVETNHKINIPIDLKNINIIFIDYSFRMLDVNYDNNIFENK